MTYEVPKEFVTAIVTVYTPSVVALPDMMPPWLNLSPGGKVP